METQDLKVLMISSDRNILTESEAVRVRMEEYGRLVKELHIVLLSDKSHGLKESKIFDNVWVYPTNSSSKFLRSLDAATIGKRLVKDKNFVRGKSLITVQDPAECGWAGLEVKKKWRIPLEIQIHTDIFSPYFSGVLNRSRQVIAKKVLPHADEVRVVTKDLKSKVEKLTPAEVRVLPIYVDQEVYKRKLDFDLRGRFGWSSVILSVGRLSPEKNFPLALEVLSQVIKKFPDTGLVVVGSGPEESSLKRLSRDLKIERHVAFEGWQKNLSSYYQTANIYLQTSLYEGYGMALVEAGLSGLPVVTTAVGIALELEHGKHAYIYTPEAVENFSAGIIDLIENKSKGQNLVYNMQDFLEKNLLSKEKYLQELQSMWGSTAGKIS